jgi:hypothetical protein
MPWDRWSYERVALVHLKNAGADDVGVETLLRIGYDGWVVVESDMSPRPTTSTMLNGWEVQRVLQPALAKAQEKLR